MKELITNFVSNYPFSVILIGIAFIIWVITIVLWLHERNIKLQLEHNFKIMQKLNKKRWQYTKFKSDINILLMEVFNYLNELDTKVKYSKNDKEKKQLYHIMDSLSERRVNLLTSDDPEQEAKELKKYMKIIRKEIKGVYIDVSKNNSN